MLVGQYWYFTSSHCMSSAPYLAKFTLALIIIFYIGLFLPSVERPTTHGPSEREARA